MLFSAFRRRLVAAVGSFLFLLALPASAEQGPGPSQPVTLTAVVAPGAEPLRDASFEVTSLDPGKGPPVKATGSQGKALVQLPSGRYRVVARYDYSQAAQDIVVGTGPSSHEVSLNAGSVILRLIRHVGGPVLRQGVSWEVLSFARDANGKRRLIGSSSEAQPRFTLPEGYYVAQAKMGTRSVRHTIEVNTGINYKYTVILQ